MTNVNSSRKLTRKSICEHNLKPTPLLLQGFLAQPSLCSRVQGMDSHMKLEEKEDTFQKKVERGRRSIFS